MLAELISELNKMMNLFIFIKCCALLSVGRMLGADGHRYDHIPRTIAPTTSAATQEAAVFELIQRAVGNETAQRFAVRVDKSMTLRSYAVSTTANRRIHIAGHSGIDVTKGFHYVLKYVLAKDVTWLQTSIDLAADFEVPELSLNSSSANPIIYYQNVCTWSYSFAWWGWSTWRRHIDWMAMMGISLTIAPIQEAIWYDVYTELGLSEAELAEHFAGPGFQAWQRMGNIRGWAGPLPASYRHMQMLLQLQILQAQRALGIAVALPAFAGHVPNALVRLYTNATFTSVPRWNHFPDPFCCSKFLEPTQPLFTELGTKFLHRINEVYGTDHIYFSDPFNENEPRLAEVDYMSSTAKNIYNSMRQVDSKAIWLLQGWMFVKNDFWEDDLIEAFLTAVPTGRMLVLDLQSEQFPQYQRTYSYYGQPFIWCMLQNFGGTLGMLGSAEIVNTEIRNARHMPHSSMLGVGITPEGIHQNYVMYSLTMERAWAQDDFDLSDWFAYYATVRYGVQDAQLSELWQLLQRSVYAYKGLRRMRGKYTITRRPALNLAPWIWYNASDVAHAWQLLLNSNATINNDNAYEHDLVDLTRQYLQTVADRLYVNLKSAYKKADVTRFNYIAKKLLKLFADLEAILATNEDFLLGPWLAAAKSLANNAAESQLYEFNARNQITTWGPTGQILDYATKQWSGIVRDYYQPRWSLFLNETQHCLAEKKPFNSTAFKQHVAERIENPFSLQTNNYPLTGVGNVKQVSQRIYHTWTAYFEEHKFLRHNRLHVKLLK